jgi:hypothetical protein
MLKVSRSALVALFLAAAPIGISAEGGVGAIFPAMSSALPEEAPSSLFDAKLGKGPDADAELLVSGSWSATLLSSIDLQSKEGSALSVASFSPILFTQDPAIALSFLLYKKVFVEAEVSDDVAKAKYSAGYRGGKGELLRELRVGNDSISFPSLPYLSFGAGSYRSFGASVLVGDEAFAGKAMIRYDQAERVEKRFIGGTEVSDSKLKASSFISGKYFLSLSAPAANLVVYVQSASGSLSGSDGLTYRKLDAGEYSYEASTGFIALSSAATTRVLARYSGSGSGADAITVAGAACDFLYDPPSSEHASAALDPKLQVLSRYATTATSSTALAYVLNPSAAAEDPLFDAEIDDSGYVEITQADAPALSSASSSAERAAYRQPFADSSHGDMAWIYTTDFDSDANIGYAPSYTRSVVLRSFSSAATIAIDADFVPGSVEVSRDGLPDYSFSVNADTGVVTLVPPPSASEEIVVAYMKQSSETKSGIVVGALGGFWDLGSGGNAWAALGATWSVPGSSYSSSGSTSPGSLALTAGLKDTEGAFTSSAALAGRYTREDSTGLYRIEGMEAAGDYATSFRPLSQGYSAAATFFSAVEKEDEELDGLFPTLIGSLHADGSSQEALSITAGSGAAALEAGYYKVEDSVEYASFKTFSFYAKLPAGAALALRMDDGAAVPATSVGITIPADPSRSYAWRRYILHYGKADSTVYVQDSEAGSEIALEGASSTLPSLSAKGSRMAIIVSGLASGETAWIDEACLSDAEGDAALLMQAKAAYEDKTFSLGPAAAPFLKGIEASGHVQGALDSDPYAAGGGAVSTTISIAGFGLAKLGINASASVSSGDSSFSGGHSIALPAEAFPLQVADGFDYDPSSGAFGRSDSLSLGGGGIGSLKLEQSSAWTPAASVLSEGMLVQTWKGGLVLGPSIVSMGLSGKNRSWPQGAPAPGGSGVNYAEAWIGAFQYALPECEGSSDLREVKASLSIKDTRSKEYLSATLGETSTPQASSAGLRRDAASIRLAAPLSIGKVGFEPYYSRAWQDKRAGAADGIVDDALASLDDFAALPLLYEGLLFDELFSSATLADFSAQSAAAGIALPLASYVPEVGLSMTREYGSSWIDFIFPSALALSYGRSLERESDTVTDAAVWSATAKIASINLFGSMGSYPISLGRGPAFDSDEYLSTFQAKLSEPRDGGASSLDLLFHGLATLYSGQADRLDIESKAAVAKLPESLSWSSSLALALSRRHEKHWLLDLYGQALALALPKKQDEKKEASVASKYFVDLASRTPNFRSTIKLSGGPSGYESDGLAYLPGWALAESYEAKITVPERLTLKFGAAFDQSLKASTQVLSLGFELSLNAVISF